MDRFTELFQEVSLYFSKMSASQKLTLGMFVFTVSIIFITITSSALQTEEEILFNQLSKDEESMILTKLESYGTKMNFKNGAIYVAKGSRDEIMMRLSIDKALPEVKKWDLVDFATKENDWTETSEGKKQRYLIAVQNSLANSISSMDIIESAQVIISKPSTSRISWSEDWEKRSASVRLDVKYGRKLNQDQVEGIANLVSGAVEGLDPEKVSIVDSKGRPYKVGDEDDMYQSGKLEKWEQVKKLEGNYEDKIKKILESFQRKSLDDIRVSVSLTLNLDRVVKKSDRVLPDETVVSMKSTKESTSNSTTSNGKTGAQGNAGDTGNSDGGKTQTTQTTDKDIKTEFSRELIESVKHPGEVEHISVAVTLPYASSTDDKGVLTESKLDPASINDAIDLVLKGVGSPLKKEDIVIKSVPYVETASLEDIDTKKWYEHIQEFIPPWFDPLKAVLGVILMFVVMKLLNVTKKAQRNLENEEDDEIGMMVKKVQDGADEDQRLNELEENLAKAINEDVKKAATIVKRWAISG